MGLFQLRRDDILEIATRVEAGQQGDKEIFAAKQPPASTEEEPLSAAVATVPANEISPRISFGSIHAGLRMASAGVFAAAMACGRALARVGSG